MAAVLVLSLSPPTSVLHTNPRTRTECHSTPRAAAAADKPPCQHRALGRLAIIASRTYSSSGMRSAPPKHYFTVLNFIPRHHALPNQDDVGPLKALIAYTSLVHPDHPLRKPGVNGIELYLGE